MEKPKNCYWHEGDKRVLLLENIVSEGHLKLIAAYLLQG